MIWGTVWLAAGLGPEDAKSNLAKWAAHLGITNWPPWLSDRTVIFGVPGVVLLFYAWLFWPRRSLPAGAALPQPDLSLGRALDYLVNDSIAVLAANPPPDLERFGPSKDQPVVFRGVPQQDALIKLEEQLAFGTLSAFGRIANAPGPEPTGFDARITLIPSDYWKDASFHPMYGRINASEMPQTVAKGLGYAKVSLYADVALNRRQVEGVWRRRSWIRRTWTRLLGERIGDYLAEDPGSRDCEVVATKKGWDNVRLRHPGDRWVRTLRVGQRLPSWQQFAEDYDAGARQRRMFRLGGRSVSEGDFLHLFTVESLPMREGDVKSFLSNAVYDAGVVLAHDGVIEMTQTAAHMVRFTVPDLTASLWDIAGPRDKILNRSIDIDLNLVLGTLASGGGSPGGRGPAPPAR